MIFEAVLVWKSEAAKYDHSARIVILSCEWWVDRWNQ